jgi:outer membrane protein OmpA-like peptidoglycan-associated protein
MIELSENQKSILRVFLLVALVVTCNTSSYAQSDSLAKSAAEARGDLYSRNVSFGAIGGANLNEHFTNFQSLPGIPDCSPTYQHGIGIGGNAGVAANIPLSSKFALSLRGVYTIDGGTLLVNEPTSISVAGVATGANIQHTIQTTLGLADFEPTASYNIFGGFRAYAGFGVGYLLSATFDQEESLTQPADIGAFTNGSRVRNEVTGSLPNDSKIVTSILAGVNYELPLNASGSLHALPELSWGDWLTSPVKGLPWNVFNFRGGLAVMYTVPDAPPPVVAPPPVAPPPPPPPVVPKKPELIVQVSAAGLDPDGLEHPKATVKVEEIYETRVSPLVPYIFFNENSTELPARYSRLQQGDTATFSTTAFYNYDRLSLYHQELNILGSRLAKDPDAHITITGCNANVGAEQNNRTLSKARAEAVRDYFASVWNISPDRMTVKSRDLPASPSPNEDSDGVVENRRVEITSDSPDIFAPVALSDTVRDATPPVIRFHTSARAEAGVASWKLDAGQDGNSLKTFQGNGNLPKNVDWNLDNDQQHVPRAPGKLNFALVVQDSAGGTAKSADSIQIEQFTLLKKKRLFAGNAEVEHYSVLLFNFKSAELSNSDRKYIESIRKQLPKNAVVTVEGYCDRIGNAEANHTLAEQRAHAVAQLLGAETIEARGRNELLYDNAIPEGRFYSRTVEVTVAMPKQQEQ